MTVNKDNQLFKPSVGRWRIILVTSITLATGLAIFSSISQFKLWSHFQPTLVHPPKATPIKVAVTALGRLQPEGKVTFVSVSNLNNGVRVWRLAIKEGDEVHAGQILAYLDNYDSAKEALQQAKDKLQVAKDQLAQVKAGAKPADIKAQVAAVANLGSQYKGDVATQKATINQLQAQVDNAQVENNRYQKLYKEGAVPASVADSKALQLKTTQQQLKEAQASLNRTQNTFQDQLKEAKAKLKSISEVRKVDVDLAEGEVKSADTAVKQAQADLELTYIQAPINGKILKINTKAGEVIGSSGFAEIGKISHMSVIAEVYQTDITKVHIGQKASITSTAFSGKLSGTVKEIGWQVDKQGIFSLNPGADTDHRIVEVKISLDNPADSQRVARLTNLQVDVLIHTYN